jgi:cytidyltransferase-like protein
MGEYVPHERLEEVMAGERKHRRKIVLTGGCFDIIHPGHIYLIEVAKGLGDVLVANVVNDDRIREYKGRGRPLMEEMERVRVVSGMEGVNYSTIHPSVKTNPTIDLAFTLRPDILVQTKLPEEGSMEERRLEELQEMGVEFKLLGRSSYGGSSGEFLKRINEFAPRMYGSVRRKAFT